MAGVTGRNPPSHVPKLAQTAQKEHLRTTGNRYAKLANDKQSSTITLMEDHSKPKETPRPDEPTHADTQPSQNDRVDNPNHVATAYHESGHAVVAISLGRQIKKATVKRANLPTGGVRLGAVMFEKGRSKPTDDWLEDEVMILLAGMVAEASFTGRYCEQGAAVDLRAVDRLLDSRVRTQRQLDKLRQRLINKTEHLLGEPAHAMAVKAVAKELLIKGEVSGRLVRHHLNQAIAQQK